jgi:hypothetical protein
MAPIATVFTRIPRLAYAIASDLAAQAAPSQPREHGRYAVNSMVDQARRLHDMAAALFLQPRDGELSGVKEPGKVDAQDGGIVGFGLLSEGLAMKMPALLTSVSMRPNRTRH